MCRHWGRNFKANGNTHGVIGMTGIFKAESSSIYMITGPCVIYKESKL